MSEFWTCSACTLENSVASPICELCGHGSTLCGHGSTVKCVACTFLNHAGYLKCKICRASLTIIVPETPVARRPQHREDQSAPQREKDDVDSIPTTPLSPSYQIPPTPPFSSNSPTRNLSPLMTDVSDEENYDHQRVLLSPADCRFSQSDEEVSQPAEEIQEELFDFGDDCEIQEMPEAKVSRTEDKLHTEAKPDCGRKKWPVPEMILPPAPVRKKHRKLVGEEKAQHDFAKLQLATSKGKFKFEEILVLIDSEVDVCFREMLVNALKEAKFPYCVQSLCIPRSVQWRWTSKVGPEKDVDCIMRRVSASDFFHGFLESPQLQQDTAFALAQRPHATFSIFVDGLRSLIQSKTNNSMRGKQAGAWSWPKVEASVTQAWFNSGGRVRYVPSVSLEEVCASVLTTTKKLAEAPYRIEDTMVSLAKSTRTLDQRGADLSRLRRMANQSESWIKFLSQIPGCSETKAAAVARQFPTLGTLMRQYQLSDGLSTPDDNGSEVANSQLLKDVLIVRSQRLGPILSRRIYRALCSRNVDEDLNE